MTIVGKGVKMVTDKNGVEIIKGQTVIVHQEEEIRKAKVVEPFADNPTVKFPGWWVDIDFGDGIQGMMSYILEVIVQPRLSLCSY